MHLALGTGPQIFGNDGYHVCHEVREAKPSGPGYPIELTGANF